MNPLVSESIFGNWATPLLHIKSDESICFESLEKDLKFIVSCGVNGVYTNGTAGEFNEQTEIEYRHVSEITAEICSESDTPFQIGASHTSTGIMLERIKFAAKLHPGAIQVILPDWVPVNNDEAVGFLRRASDAADGVSLVLYNPPHAKRVLAPKEFAFLKAQVPALVGIKVKSGDESWFAEIRHYCSDLSVFIPGHFLAGGLAQGASGSYSNIACLHPLGAQRWYEMMLASPESALALEKRILEFMKTYILPFRTERHYCSGALDKMLAAIGGWGNAGTKLRFPYLGVNEEEIWELHEAARSLIPEIVCPAL